MADPRTHQLLEQQSREHQSHLRGLRAAVDAEITRLNTRIGQLIEQRDEFRAALARAENEVDAIRAASGDATDTVRDLLRRHRFREEVDEDELAELIVRQAVDPVAGRLRQAQAHARARGRVPRSGRRRGRRPW